MTTKGGGLDPGPFFQQFFGILDLLQPASTTSQLIGQFVAVTVMALLEVLSLIGGPSFRQNNCDLLLEPLL